MARRRKSRPADPIAIAQARALARAAERERVRDPTAWGVVREALDLPANALVAARRDLAGRIVRAVRQDVFDLLRARGALSAAAYDAARRLQADVARANAGAGGVCAYRERVDSQRRASGPSEAALDAGGRIQRVLARTGAGSASLLLALIEAPAGSAWRDVVARISGETLADAQSAVVRQACENLAAAYVSGAVRARL